MDQLQIDTEREFLKSSIRRNGKRKKDLAEIFFYWGEFAFTQKEYGAAKWEHDIFDSDDYLQFHGGLINAINTIKGAQDKGKVTEYFGDSPNPVTVKIKILKEEVRRVVNPKWINSMKDHGYKGGLEMAETVDYMYENVTERYLLDKETQEFLKKKNPLAIRSMGERLVEADNRGLWKNPDPELILEIESLVSSAEADIGEKL